MLTIRLCVWNRSIVFISTTVPDELRNEVNALATTDNVQCDLFTRYYNVMMSSNCHICVKSTVSCDLDTPLLASRHLQSIIVFNTVLYFYNCMSLLS